MRIIEEGPSEFSHEFTCPRCKTKLEATAEDVRLGDFGSIGECRLEYYTECTICQYEYRLDEKAIPFRVKQLAHKKAGKSFLKN